MGRMASSLPNHRHRHIQSEAHPASIIRRRIIYRERCHLDGQRPNPCPGRF